MPASQKGETIRRRGWLLLWLVPVVLFAAAAYELALALDLVGSYTATPGQDVEGEETVAAVARLTMLVGAVVALVHAIRPRSTWAVALFAPAAAAFILARIYTYDPYYLPSLRRYSDEGDVLEWWIVGMLAVSIVVGFWCRLRPRAGSIATALMLPLLWLTSLLAAAGH